jgi:PAS domain S-box-containing protein
VNLKPRAPPVTLDLALMRGALEEVPVGVATTRGTDILHANSAFERLYGAAPGELDGRPLADLLGATGAAEVQQALDRRRVYDGRLRTRNLAGEEIHAELHVERYMSSADGTGGFVIARDVSFEVGALSRLLDQLGGAQFRVRVRDGALEHVTPAIEALVGRSAGECLEHPDRLADAVSPAEVERVRALYRRLCNGELAVASAEVEVRCPGGARTRLQLRATGRRDTGGSVRHIDGVVTDANVVASEREQLAARDSARSALLPGARPSPFRFPAAEPMLDVTRALLEEVLSLLGETTSELGVVRTAAQAVSGAVPGNVARELGSSLQAAQAHLGAATALQRRLRRAIDRRPSSGPLVNALESARVALAAIAGEQAVKLDAGEAGSVEVRAGLDSLTVGLTYLGLRVFRLAGAGALRIVASMERSSYDGGGTAPRRVRIELVAEPPGGSGSPAVEQSSGLASAIPRHAEMLAVFESVVAMMAAVGTTLDADEVTARGARTVLRFSP